MAFQAVEDELRETFLPALFKGAKSQIPGRTITDLPVKQSWIYLPDPTQTVGANWAEYCVITGHLVAALRRTAEFRLGYHDLLMGEGTEDIRQRHAKAVETDLGEAQADTSKTEA